MAHVDSRYYVFWCGGTCFLSTVTKSSLAQSVGQQFNIFTLKYHLTTPVIHYTTLTGLRFCIKRNLLLRFRTTAMWKTLCGLSTLPANTKRWPIAASMPAHRLRCWSSTKPALVQRFVFAGIHSITRWSGSVYCWRRVQADTSIHSALVSISCWRECVQIVYTAPMPFKYWPASYTMARHRTNGRYTDTLPGQWWACVA